MTLTVSEDKKSMILTYLDGTEEMFTDLPTLDEAIRASGEEVSIDKEVYELFGERYMLSYPIEGGKYFAVISSITDEDRYALLQETYSYALMNIDSYRDDPSFMNAWKLVNTHPAFWLARNIHTHPWSWQTSGHCSQLRQELDWTEETGPIISLSTGGHVPKELSDDQPAYSQHYGDWRLEVAGLTFEEAIMALADRVVLCFNDDGTNKPEDEIELPIPEWVLELEERLSDEIHPSDD